MLKKMISKLASIVFAVCMFFALASPAYAYTWPDPGYNHIPSEDRTYETNAEALSYAQKYAQTFAYKYHCNIEYEVKYDGPKQFRAVFYGLNYKTPQQPVAPKQNKGRVRVLAYELNVRTGPGTENKIVSWSPLYYNEIVEFIDNSKKDSNGVMWYEIETDHGKGFISSEYAEFMDTDPIIEAPGDVGEFAFAEGKKFIKEETRFFSDEQSMINFCTSQKTGIYMYNTYKSTMYYYYSKTPQGIWTVHWFQ